MGTLKAIHRTEYQEQVSAERGGEGLGLEGEERGPHI